ncbi:uncharacterized protein LOC144491895 [Mustelus asterias]
MPSHSGNSFSAGGSAKLESPSGRLLAYEFNMPSDTQQDMNNSEIKDSFISDKQLMELAGKLGENWKKLAIMHLGLKQYDVDNFVSNGINNQDRAFLMLHFWKCREKRPTVGSLICALDKAELDPDAWAFLHRNNNFNGLRCKCCQQLMSCQCKCNLTQEITCSTPNDDGYNFNIKVTITKVLDVKNEANKKLDDLFKELFKTKIDLRLKFQEIANSMESNLLTIASGCIDLQMQALSYAALLNLSLQFVKTVSERIKQLPPLHQKLQDAMVEGSENIMAEMLSFTNYFGGGSYKSALEFFCGGYSIDDMLPIIKRRKLFQNIGYLCIDVKTAPLTALSDLKREFVKVRHRELHKLETKLSKGQALNQSELKLIRESLPNISNRPNEEHGEEFRKVKIKDLPGDKTIKANEKAECGEKQLGESGKAEALKRGKASKDLAALGKRSIFLKGLASPETKMERVQELETPRKKMKKIQNVKSGKTKMKKIQEFEIPGGTMPPGEKMRKSNLRVIKSETNLNYQPPVKQKKITKHNEQLVMAKIPQKPYCLRVEKEWVRKKASLQSKESDQKGEIDIGQEDSTSKMKEHEHGQQETDKKRALGKSSLCITTFSGNHAIF